MAKRPRSLERVVVDGLGGTTLKILVTGNMGYVGPVAVSALKHSNSQNRIIGYDSGFFAHCLTGANESPERLLDAQHFGDVREFPESMLRGCDAVVHLSAVSNDPIGERFSAVTEDINFRASTTLARAAAIAGVRSFVFASSCSIYGFAAGGARRESDALNPLTAYAKSKVATEEALQEIEGDMVITSLRFATACGMSPRLRLDLVLNDFVACALTSGEITVLSDGTPWRPLIDVKDMARAICWALERSERDGGRYLAVNVGCDEWNYQVKDLAEAVRAAIPGTRVSVNKNALPDKRSYRVDFSLYKSLAPSHRPQATLSSTIAELKAGLVAMDFHDKDFRTSPLVRLEVLKGHIADSRLSADLRWSR